jgi:hypothetical protein
VNELGIKLNSKLVYIYIYICVCVCVCVCAYKWNWKMEYFQNLQKMHKFYLRQRI